MANYRSCVAGCALPLLPLLPLLLLSLSGRTSTGQPVRALSAETCARCSALFRSLLLNIAELFSNEDLCYGIKSDTAVVRSKAETLLTCTPTPTQNSRCMMQRNASFSESECLKNIMKDMGHYNTAIQSYLKLPLRNPEKEVPLLNHTLEIIKNLRENCSLNGENDSSEVEAVPLWGNKTFDNRQEMCKIMRGFYTRTITINRAMGYISSGDHQK